MLGQVAVGAVPFGETQGSLAKAVSGAREATADTEALVLADRVGALVAEEAAAAQITKTMNQSTEPAALGELAALAVWVDSLLAMVMLGRKVAQVRATPSPRWLGMGLRAFLVVAEAAGAGQVVVQQALVGRSSSSLGQLPALCGYTFKTTSRKVARVDPRRLSACPFVLGTVMGWGQPRS